MILNLPEFGDTWLNPTKKSFIIKSIVKNQFKVDCPFTPYISFSEIYACYRRGCSILKDKK